MEKDTDRQVPHPKTREFVRVEREHGPHPASKALHRKPRGERSGTEVREFARIDRGRET